MATSTKLDLEKTKLNLEFYKARAEQQPNHIYLKWVQIYTDRVKKLERQLAKETKTSAQAAH